MSPRTSVTLVVDPVLCDGRGVCAELFPEGITLDVWGYPLLRDGEIPDGLLDHARRAVASCPKGALTIREVAPQKV